ncbi:MAG: DUF4956 domain-containing protein [Bacteroidota bacterium]|nr:DUF4956 domain-containing protein [Bacteroidota bacterium]
METTFNSPTMLGVLMRFMLEAIFLFILIRLLYFRYTKKEKFLFTLFLMGISVFFICFILKEENIGLGIGLGMFAILSVMRFRTRNFSVKDMAYTFATVGISVINAVPAKGIPILGYLIINSIIVASVFILEQYLLRNTFSKYSIFYDNLGLLKPGNRNKLIKELSSRTGLDIDRIKICYIDFTREIAHLEIYYKE